jgi:hypothetical protein
MKIYTIDENVYEIDIDTYDDNIYDTLIAKIKEKTNYENIVLIYNRKIIKNIDNEKIKKYSHMIVINGADNMNNELSMLNKSESGSELSILNEFVTEQPIDNESTITQLSELFSLLQGTIFDNTQSIMPTIFDNNQSIMPTIFDNNESIMSTNIDNNQSMMPTNIVILSEEDINKINMISEMGFDITNEDILHTYILSGKNLEVTIETLLEA